MSALSVTFVPADRVATAIVAARELSLILLGFRRAYPTVLPSWAALV